MRQILIAAAFVAVASVGSTPVQSSLDSWSFSKKVELENRKMRRKQPKSKPKPKPKVNPCKFLKTIKIALILQRLIYLTFEYIRLGRF